MWDIRYRPLRFGDVLGQQGSVRVLKARLANGTALDTSYIFSGGPGQGKTTLGRILARAILCQQLNLEDPEPCNECDNCKGALEDNLPALVELDAASRGTIEHVRKIVDDLPFAVYGAKKRVYLIDECHRMSKDAQDVLLKPLEEKKLVGMFCTTEPDKVRPAIRTRCEEYQIRKVTREDILARMKMVLETEKVEYEDDGVLTVIDACGGHVRDVLNKLEMVAQMGPVSVEAVRSHLNLAVVSTYYEILLHLPGNTREALNLIDRACDRVTPEEVSTGIAEAAMNAFRLANGMIADFTFVDRGLGDQLWKLYGTQLVKIADFFVHSKYTTQIGLVCDAVSLAQSLGGGGSVPTQTVPATPTFQPVVQAQPQPMVAAQPQVQVQEPGPARPPSISPPVPVVPQPTLPSPEAAAKPAPLKFVPQPTGGSTDGRRPDGVGSLNSGDPCALTEYDSEAVPKELPANKHAKKPLVFDENRDREGRDPIAAGSWRRQFETLWTSRTGGSDGN